MKEKWGLDKSYKFEWNDLRAVITVVNVILIMIFGLSIAWFGLIVALLGLIKDFVKDHRINGAVMHLANVVLNLYFICIL